MFPLVFPCVVSDENLLMATDKSGSSCANYDTGFKTTMRVVQQVCNSAQCQLLFGCITNTLNVNTLAAVHDGWKGTTRCVCGELDTAEHIVECPRTAGLRRALWMTAETRLSVRAKKGRAELVKKAEQAFKNASRMDVKMAFAGGDCTVTKSLATTMGLPLAERRKEIIKMAGRHLEVSRLRMAQWRPSPITGTLF